MEAAGAAYIFERAGDNWKRVQKIVANDRSPYDNFGSSVSISRDNAIVGAWNTTETADENSEPSTGSAYIFSRDAGGGWGQAQKLMPSDRKARDRYGYSVAISNNFAIVGTPHEDEDNGGKNTIADAGSVYIFWQNNSGGWIQSQKIVASDRETFDWFGSSVAISRGFVIAGAIAEDHDVTGKNELTSSGSAYIFKRQTPVK